MGDAEVPGYLLNLYQNHADQGVDKKHYDRSAHLNEKIQVSQKWDAVLRKAFKEKAAKVIKIA